MPGSGDHMARRQIKSGDGVSRTSVVAADLLQKEIKARAVVPKMQRPKFANEEEEAAWYPAHPEYLEAFFKQAEREGKLGHGTAARVLGLTTPTTIRLSQEDLAKARAQAEKKGLRYQTYLKMLLHEALAKSNPADEDSTASEKPKRTPQEKKKLSLEHDRRNMWGNNQKAARKCTPKSKKLGTALLGMRQI
jgi:hypothetical protein